MSSNISILGFAGSLRKNSYNKALLHAATKLVPQNANLEIFDLEGIPLYNQDHEHQPPERVKEFKAKIAAANAILIACPEYNYSIPGVLKNAIDWASRPPEDNPFDEKPAAIISASPGRLGGARAQYHLRQTMVALNMHQVNWPEVMLPNAGTEIDENGKIKNEKTLELIGELLQNLVNLANILKTSNLTTTP